MASLKDILFGTKPKETKVTQPALDPRQSALLGDIISSMRPGLQRANTALSPMEKTSLAALEQYAMNLVAQPPGATGPGGDALSRVLNEQRFTPDTSLLSKGAGMVEGAAGTGVNPAMDSRFIEELMSFAGTTGPAFDQYYQQNVADPLYQDFQENVVPLVDRKFGGADYFGTDRVKMMGDVTDKLVQSLVRGKNEALLGAREQTLGALRSGGEQSLSRDRSILDTILSQRGQDIQAGTAIAGAGAQQAGLLSEAFLGGRGQDIQAGQALESLRQQGLDTGGDNTLEAIIAMLQGGGLQRTVSTAERDKMLQALLAALGTKTTDNTVVAQPGSPGIVQGIASGAGTGLGAFLGSKMMCWVAEELYGVYHEKTYRVRTYCLKHLKDNSMLGRFCRLYQRYGKTWAKWIRRSKTLRMIAGAIWNGLYIASQEESDG